MTSSPIFAQLFIRSVASNGFVPSFVQCFAFNKAELMLSGTIEIRFVQRILIFIKM